MLRLLRWGVMAAALAAVVAFAPVGGRTVLERWRASSGPGDFAARALAEARGALRGAPAREPQARAAPRPAPAARPGQPAPPAEHHTEADRKALEAIVAEHAR